METSPVGRLRYSLIQPEEEISGKDHEIQGIRPVGQRGFAAQAPAADRRRDFAALD